MKTTDEIARLRSAEREALDITAQAGEKAQRIRDNAETRVAQLIREIEDSLAATRTRMESEGQSEREKLAFESRKHLVSALKAVSEKLEAGRHNAVKIVTAELTKLQ